MIIDLGICTVIKAANALIDSNSLLNHNNRIGNIPLDLRGMMVFLLGRK